MQVAAFLERAGFKDVTNLTGGVHAWAMQVDTSMPTY
jgi:rhodanese-related sulfurtransferase